MQSLCFLSQKIGSDIRYNKISMPSMRSFHAFIPYIHPKTKPLEEMISFEQ